MNTPNTKKFVAYLRVSTQKQGANGLGIDAQRAAVAAHLKAYGGELLAEFSEAETGKGSNALEMRPQLRAALALCKKQRAVLLVAKLDRLARNVHFISGLMESGVEFIAADMPHSDKMMIHMMAAVAEWERGQISARTKAALAAAKARGVVLGRAGPDNLRPNVEQRQQEATAFAEGLRPTLADMLAKGLTRRQMVVELDNRGITTPRGKQWSLAQLQAVLKRLELT